MTRTANVLDKLVDAVVSSGGEKLTNAVTETLLWTNPNPTSSFGAQSLSIPNNTSEYDRFKIVLMTDSTSPNRFCTFEGDRGKVVQTSALWSTTELFYRNVNFLNDGRVDFGDCSKGNTYLIPYQIYGIRTVTALDKGVILADYVVERGTDGNWRYEKWDSGKYEIWYRGELSLAFNTLVATPIYSTAQQTIYYPETMAGVHYAEVNFQANTPHCLGAYISVTAVDRVQFFAKANIQSTFGGYVHIHVIGRWK